MPDSQSNLKGIILMFYKDGEVPSGWKVCNGKNGTPNFEKRFPKGVQNDEQIGEKSEKDATYYKETILSKNDIPPHTHKVDSKANDFNKTWYWNGSGRKPAYYYKDNTGQYGVSYASDCKNEALDMRPPYFDIRYIHTLQIDTFVILPGTVVMMDPNYKQPRGWALCDGSKNTPNTIERFPQGYIENDGNEQEGGNTEVVLSKENLPDHYHAVQTCVGNAFDKTWSGSGSGRKPCLPKENVWDEEKGILQSVGVKTVSSKTNDIPSKPRPVSLIPMFQKVRFICCKKTSRRRGISAIPKGTIAISLQAKLPAGWKLCDGKDGRPDFKNRIPRGSSFNTKGDAHGGNEMIKLKLENLPDHIHQFKLPFTEFDSTWGTDGENKHVRPARFGGNNIINSEKNSIDKKAASQFEDFPGTIGVYFIIKV